MRRPVLQRWLRRELLALSELEKFSLLKIASLAQTTNSRLVAPLFLYCWECGALKRLEKYIYNESIMNTYNDIATLLEGIDLSGLALSGKAANVLPREYAKHLDSFAAEYHMADTVAASKEMRRSRCLLLQLQKGVSTTEICKALHLNVPNVCAFLKQGDLRRLSLQDATAMMKYLMAL